MKQNCSNTFSLVALVDVILVTTMLYIESTIQNHQRMPAEFYIFSLYEGM